MVRLLNSILCYLVFCCLHQFCLAQTEKTFDIDSLAAFLNLNLKGKLYEGIEIVGVESRQNVIVFSYSVPINWAPFPNSKQTLIHELKSASNAPLYIQNNISLEYNYYMDEELKYSLKIEPVDLINDFLLGGYISLKDYPKAKGVNIKFKPPSNWEIQEGDRPNIVKKFTNSAGSTFLVQINENLTFIPKSIGKELIEEISAIEFLDGMAGMVSGLKIYESENVTVDNYPAKYIQYGGEMERAGISFRVQSHYWVCYYEDTLVTLSGMYLGKAKDSKMEALFYQIVNSVQFPDQWK